MQDNGRHYIYMGVKTNIKTFKQFVEIDTLFFTDNMQGFVNYKPGYILVERALFGKIHPCKILASHRPVFENYHDPDFNKLVGMTRDQHQEQFHTWNKVLGIGWREPLTKLPQIIL